MDPTLVKSPKLADGGGSRHMAKVVFSIVLCTLLFACSKGSPNDKAEFESAVSSSSTAKTEESPVSKTTASPSSSSPLVSAPKSPYGDFSKLVNDAAKSLLASARGEKRDNQWGLAGQALTGSKRLDDAQLVFSSLVVDAEGPHGFLKLNLLVTPEGEIQFSNFTKLTSPRREVATKDHPSPVFANFAQHVLGQLSQKECDLPIVKASTHERLPPRIASRMGRAESRAKAALRRACKRMASKGDGYRPRLVDIRLVLVRKKGGLLRLRSPFRLVDGKLQLGPPRWR